MSTNADKILRTFHFRSDVPATHTYTYTDIHICTQTQHIAGMPPASHPLSSRSDEKSL